MGSPATNGTTVVEDIILHSTYKPIPIPKQGLVEYLLDRANLNARHGKTKWLTDALTGETIKYADIDGMSWKIATTMYRKGMKKGDIVLYSTANVTRIYIVMLGAWRAGGCMHSSYAGEKAEALTIKIRDTKARWIFCDPDSVAEFQEAANQVEWTVEILVFGQVAGYADVNTFLEGSEIETEILGFHEEADEDRPLLIVGTSGTTGKSRGAAYSGFSILAFCAGTTFPWNSKPILYLSKTTHITGALNPFRNILSGIWSVLVPFITPLNTLVAIQQYQPFVVFSVPAYLLPIVNHREARNYDRRSIEFICVGGYPLTPQVIRALKTLPSIKAILNGYGMTECIGITASIDLSHQNEWRPTPKVPPLSVGRLYPNTSLKVLDLDTGHSLGTNSSGELAIQSPGMSIGYWSGNRVDQESAATFTNGWLRTGDLGYYDENGFLFVTGRLKETIKYMGNSMSPEELEEIILEHSAVSEACVFGVQAGEEGFGHVPRAVLVLKADKTVSPEEIETFVHEKVPPYKRLRGGVFFVSALPRGKNGKVMRSLVASMPFHLQSKPKVKI